MCACQTHWWRQLASAGLRQNGKCAPSQPRLHTRSMQVHKKIKSTHGGRWYYRIKVLAVCSCADKTKNGPWISCLCLRSNLSIQLVEALPPYYIQQSVRGVCGYVLGVMGLWLWAGHFSAGLQSQSWGSINPIMGFTLLWNHCLKLWDIKEKKIIWPEPVVFEQKKKREESHKDIKQTSFNTRKLFRIQVAVGSMIIHWFEAISFSSWLKLNLTWNTKAAFLLTWHWMSQIRENRNKRGYCEDQLVVMFTTRPQLRRSSIYCPADSQCLIPNLEFYPKSWFWRRQNYY